MPINTGNFPKLLWPGINAIYGAAYKEHKAQYPEIFDKYTSTKGWEEDVGVTGFGLAQIKSEGGSISYDTAQQGYIQRYTHVTYGLGFVITREMYEDNQYQLPMINNAKGLAFSMNQTKETVAANKLNRAFNDSYTFADGKELCATDHPNVMGGTWANEPTTAADLSEASLEQACIDVGKWENDRGLKINVQPVKLIIPVDLEFEAVRILKSILQNDTANNAINALKATGKIRGGIAINNYLDDTDAWFVKTDCPNGLKWFERRKDDFGMDNDFDTENGKYKATARYSFGCTDPRAIYGSPGA